MPVQRDQLLSQLSGQGDIDGITAADAELCCAMIRVIGTKWRNGAGVSRKGWLPPGHSLDADSGRVRMLHA